jgi:DNA replication protein DnaC
MNLNPQLLQNLKQLRLSGVLDTLEIRNRQAIEQKLSYTDFLMQLVHDEVERREQKKLATRLRRAGFTGEKTLENFNFEARPTLNRQYILDLATCSFIEECSRKRYLPETVEIIWRAPAAGFLRRPGGM